MIAENPFPEDADDDEDAMDIFGASSEQYLYTVHLYQAKNIPRAGKESSEPNVYVSIEFNQCKSGNKYQTSIIHNSIDPIFNASIFELAEESEMANITLTVYHRSIDNDNLLKKISDECIGTIVIDIESFDSWDEWLWIPISCDSEEKEAIYEDNAVQSYKGMMQLKFEYISLDDALMAHQNKDLHEYSHIICLHVDQYVPRKDMQSVNNKSFMYPLLQIQWKYDEMFETECACQQVESYKWSESHYIYCQLMTDDRSSHLIFNVLDDGMVCVQIYL